MGDECEDPEEWRGMRDVWPRYRACILVDDEVLKVLAPVPPEAEYAKKYEWNPWERKLEYSRMHREWYVKFVEPWWDEENTLYGYEGWMKVSLFTLFGFWHCLEDIPMEVQFS